MGYVEERLWWPIQREIKSSLLIATHASHQHIYIFFFSFFLVGYVEERLWWPIQSPNIARKKKASSLEDREIKSSLLIATHASHQHIYIFFFFFLVGYVEERLWWPIQSPNIARKKKASSLEDREIKSSLLIATHASHQHIYIYFFFFF